MDFLQNIHVFSLSQSLPRQGLRPWWGVRVMQIAFAFTAEEAKSDCNSDGWRALALGISSS